MLVSCASPSKTQPDPARQPWRDSWQALPAAKTGDAEGLGKYFAAAKAQLMLPFANGGEDAEAIMTNMIAILDSVGDQRFSAALLREEPKTRSAVREFLIEKDVGDGFPKTHEILVDAPLVKWPSDIAEDRSYIEAGNVPPPKKQWKR